MTYICFSSLHIKDLNVIYSNILKMDEDGETDDQR